MKIITSKILIPILLLLLSAGCSKKEELTFPPLQRMKVDNYNKLSFQNRYESSSKSIRYAEKCLQYLSDSLPLYQDGRLRAWNNLAYGHYMLAQYQEAAQFIDSVMLTSSPSSNLEIEQCIAQLLLARMMQRNCQIADSYQILNDIEQAGILDFDGEGNSYLENFAIKEYYITALSLNYHFRNGAVENLKSLLDRIEENRHNLPCDYDEDMYLNYALAHSYYKLAANAKGKKETYLKKALTFVADNLEISTHPDSRCDYHLANAYQMLAFITADTAISNQDIFSCEGEMARIESLFERLIPVSSYDSVDLTLQLFRISTDLFFAQEDPYQHLGAVVMAADYCMLVGDTLQAKDYFSMALNDSSWPDHMAPKFEAMLYKGLLTSEYSKNFYQNRQWFNQEVELLEYIKQNEKADFILQNKLAQVQQVNRQYTIMCLILAPIVLLLVVVLFLLRKKTRELTRETLRLQEANQRDLERIATIETCLSVLRHDVNPFISYLQNPNLPADLRNEVVNQLIRTFTNIKNWTSLSIPSGLRFQSSDVNLEEVFETVQPSINNFRGIDVALVFEETTLRVVADKLLLEILLRNLVNNAIQHTEKGEVRVKAEEWEEDSSFVKVSVTDTGCGMSEEVQENLFRTDKPISNPSKQEGYGSGFGLILCRYIIKKHDDNTLRGCRIWVESEEGKGSTFSFIIQKTPKE